MKSFLTYCICLLSSTALMGAPASRPVGNTLQSKQIENYVDNIVATLVGNGRQSESDRKKILSRVTKKLLMPTEWESAYKLPIERTVQEVYQETIHGIVEFVERRSFHIAKCYTGNYYSTVNIADHICNELKHVISSTGNFNQGALHDFIGTELEARVKQVAPHFPSPFGYSGRRYDEKNCRICFNRFSPSVPWIYLSPCGHDICTGCADIYFVQQGKQRCPACNQPVDTYQVQMSMYRPSAPHV
jgi:hypothetical protein